MRNFFIVFFCLLHFLANAQNKAGMLYTNCNEVYDKGDTTICIEQFDETRQLIRYYLGGNNIFSKKYSVAANGDYAFHAVLNDFDSAKNGIAYYYFQNAQLQKTLVFDHDLLLQCLAQYDKNGNALPIGTLQNGNGSLFLYDENGLKKGVQIYRNGKKSCWRTMFASKK